VKVVRVMEDSPAAKAGMKDGDLITLADGQPVQEPGQLQQLILARKAGDKMELKVKREAQELVVEVTLGEKPANARVQGWVMEGPGGEIEVRPMNPGAGAPANPQEMMERQRLEQQKMMEEIQKRDRAIRELQGQVEKLQNAIKQMQEKQ
jgi:C-terminal processing protease CtpA/Prc